MGDLTLTDNRGFEADQLDIRLDDSDGKLDIPPRGAEVRLWLGFEASGLVDKGTYTVDKIEHSGTPDVLSIRARSADLRGGLTQQRERSWHDITLGDIIRTIADENELEPVISQRLDGQLIEHIDQTNETAVNLLTRLAKQFDALTTVKDGRLLFISAAAGSSLSGKPLPASVSGWKPAIDNTDWIITRAVHTLNDNGLGTALEFEIKATEVVD